MFDALDIANYFIKKGISEGNLLSPMKVQKLVYLSHGWNLAVEDKPLIHNPIQAWNYGPVIPDLYHKLKIYGNEVIDKEISTSTSKELSGPTSTILDFVWDVYGTKSAIDLSNLTHKSGTPWNQVLEQFNGKIPYNVPIDNNRIKAHYNKIIEGVSENEPA